MKMKMIWMNGSLRSVNDTRVSPLDHGIITGDGLFETLIAYKGQVFALSRHVNRLLASARGMMMNTELIQSTNWKEAIKNLLEENGLREARVRITYTTGDADLGSDRGNSLPLLMIAASAMPAIGAEGMLCVVPWPRNERGALSGLKTISYGENVKALYQAKKNVANEALFLNTVGDVCEGTGTNVAWIKKGKIFTPSLETGCLAGITRALMIELARKSGFELEEVRAPLSALLDADEVFLTSTLREIQWVSRVDDKHWEPRTSVITSQLRKSFGEFARKNLDP
jgi:branched-chain amino acid aminotransferase